MDNTNLSISETGSMLMGAGLTKLDDLILAIALIGVGILLKIGIAYLKKTGLDVSGPNMG